MGNKYIRLLFSWVTWSIVYTLLGPLVCLYNFVLRCTLSAQVLALKKRSSEDMKNDTAGVYKDKKTNNNSSYNHVSNNEKLDFKLHRSRAYIDQLTYGGLWEISRLASGHQSVPLVSNHVLHHVLFNSVFSYGLIKEDDPCSEVEWRLPFSDLDTHAQDFCWDVAEISILKSGRMNIRDRSGKLHTPRCRTWPLAKAHVQAQLTFFAPGLVNSPAHSVLPALIAREVRRNLPTTSVLRQLIEPHTRFTQYLNYLALHESLSSSDYGRLTDRLMRPWLKMPSGDHEAVLDMEKKCKKFGHRDMILAPKIDETIAYQSFLKEYYDIFHNFVSELSPLLKNDYDILKSSIFEHIPTLAQESMVDVIAEFLWNSAVVHGCNHESYLQQWAKKYGCMYIRKPLVKVTRKTISINTITNGKTNRAFIPDSLPPGVTESHPHVINTHNFTEDDGSHFFRSIDVCRTRCFLRTYVQYVPSKDLDMTLVGTEYEFSDSLATSAAAEFFTNLKDMNSFLKQRGEALVQGDKFIRSICF